MDIKQVIDDGKNLKTEVREKTVGYILSALGLVAGLAWNEAIKDIINQLLPISQDAIWAKLIYAVLVTIFVVVLSVYLLRLSKKS